MWFFLNTFSATDVPKYVVIQARDMLTRPMCIASSVYNITVGQSSLISLSLSLLQLTSGKPLWLYLQPVDTKSRWRHNWKSAQVVNSHLMCDSTIRQPGFELPRQQWSLLNHFSTEQGHCDACRRKWQLTDRHWSVSLWRDPDDVPHCWILSFDKTEWRLISATLCRWRRCFVADQLWFVTRIWEEEKEATIITTNTLTFHTMATICKNEASKCAGHGVRPDTVLRILSITSTMQRITSSKFNVWAHTTDAKDISKVCSIYNAHNTDNAGFYSIFNYRIFNDHYQ